MRPLRLALLTSLLLSLLTGCWDTDKLADKKMINGIGLDAAEHGRILGTTSTIRLINKGGGQFDERDEVVQATGNSIVDIGNQINSMMPGKLEASKTHIIIFGEELAKKGLLAPLEVFYRNPKGNLNSKLLIAKGLAADMLAVGKTPTGSPIAFDIMQMIEGAQFASIAPEQTLYTLWMDLMDPNADVFVPMISKRNNNQIVIDNVGLMHDDKYTGVSLQLNDSKLLLLMNGKMKKTTLVNVPLEGLSMPFVFEILDARQNKKIIVDDATGQIDCNIRVKLRGDVTSYPITGDYEHNKDKLHEQFIEALEKQASKIINKLQGANCDALGVGRELKMSHPAVWKRLDWNEAYPNIHIHVTFQVNFEGTGILN